MKIAAKVLLCLFRPAVRRTRTAWLCIFLVSSFLFLVSPIRAQSCSYDPKASEQENINRFNKCAIEEDIYDDKIFNFNQTSGTVDSLKTALTGYSDLHPQTNALTAPRSALASASNMIASLYGNPPASGVEYFAQEIRKFNPVQPTYAQADTAGFQALSPVQKLWGAFRNAAYAGFVVVFVIMGFMIMFRAHISPQAVATVQDSIPRLIIALILVTFSYAIAGLMIDFMFLVINLIIQFFDASGLISIEGGAEKVIFDKSIIGTVVGAWGEIVILTAKAIKAVLDDVLGSVNLPLVGDVLGLVKIGVSGFAGLIVGIGALFIMFRIFVMLLMAYVMIILLTLFAPFYFLIQALPGNNGAKEWFKQMAANVSVFPAVSLMVLLAGILGGIQAFGATGEGALGGGGSQALKFPFLVGGIDPQVIGKLIGLGILFATPEAANMVKKAIGTQGGPAFGGAGAAALGGAAGVAYTGTGARAVVGGVRGAFGVASQATQEAVGARLPGPFGAALREKRAALGIKEKS